MLIRILGSVVVESWMEMRGRGRRGDVIQYVWEKGVVRGEIVGRRYMAAGYKI